MLFWLEWFCSLWSSGPAGCGRPLGTCLSSAAAAVLGWTSSLQDIPPACLFSNSFLFLLDTGSSWMCSVPQGSERRRRVHLLSRCPPALSSVIITELEFLLLPLLHSSSTESLLLHSFFSSCICPHGSDFLLVICLLICLSSSSSSSAPYGSLLLLPLHLSFSFHFLSIRLLRRFITLMTNWFQTGDLVSKKMVLEEQMLMPNDENDVT